MALICLTSASGSPGVTTTATALAFNWPRPVYLLEADPAGASVLNAGLYRSDAPSVDGLISLAMAQRQGNLIEEIPRAAIRPPAGSTTVSDVRIILAARSHAQAMQLTPLWEPMGSALRALDHNGVDVIVDAGRLGVQGSPLSLLRAADLTLLTTHNTLPALAVARGWADQLNADYEAMGSTDPLGLLLVGEEGPYRASEVAHHLKAPVVATINHDPTSAAVYHLGQDPRRRFTRSPLARSIRAAVSAIQATIADHRNKLVATQFTSQTGR